MELTENQKEILKHTYKNVRFNCDELTQDHIDLKILENLGFASYLGKVSWVPGLYYGLTDAGKSKAYKLNNEQKRGKK